jgi:hypothetical protein
MFLKPQNLQKHNFNQTFLSAGLITIFASANSEKSGNRQYCIYPAVTLIIYAFY